MREVAILAELATVVLDEEFAWALRLLRLFLGLWGSASGLARPGRVRLGVSVWAWRTVAGLSIKVVATCFHLTFCGLGRGLALDFSGVDRNSVGLK